MLLEALVAGMCLAGQAGCGSATTAYYESNKELQQTVKNAEELGKRLIKGNEYVIYAFTPAAAIISGKPVSFTLHSQLILNVNIKQQTMFLQWSY